MPLPPLAKDVPIAVRQQKLEALLAHVQQQRSVNPGGARTSGPRAGAALASSVAPTMTPMGASVAASAAVVVPVVATSARPQVAAVVQQVIGSVALSGTRQQRLEALLAKFVAARQARSGH